MLQECVDPTAEITIVEQTPSSAKTSDEKELENESRWTIISQGTWVFQRLPRLAFTWSNQKYVTANIFMGKMTKPAILRTRVFRKLHKKVDNPPAKVIVVAVVSEPAPRNSKTIARMSSSDSDSPVVLSLACVNMLRKSCLFSPTAASCKWAM
jgi:hypothetical protein